MEDSSRWMELPEDCWELILSRLSMDDDYSDLQSPSLVCKRFLSITDRLRRGLVNRNWVFNLHSCEEVLCRALERFRNLKGIELPDEWDIDYAISIIVSSGVNLQSLGFYRLRMPPSAESLRRLGSTMNNLKTLRCRDYACLRDSDLVAIADALPRLEELDIRRGLSDNGVTGGIQSAQLSDCMVTDAGIDAISRKLRGLRKIYMSWNGSCSDLSLIALSSNCVLLTEIQCIDCNVTEHGIYFVLCHSPNLISLRAGNCLSYSSLGPPLAFDDLKIYARALRVLDVCGCEDQDRLFCSIAEAGIPLEKLILQNDHGLSFHGLSTLISACPSLKHLELHDIFCLNDDYMRDLCRYLPNLVSIELYLSPKLTIATFFTLAKECPAVSEITLSICGFSEVPDDFFMDLETNHRITYLNLSYNWDLTDELLKKVGLVCPNLHTLDVQGCNRLTKEAIGEILTSCSQLKNLKVSEGMEIQEEVND